MPSRIADAHCATAAGSITSRLRDLIDATGADHRLGGLVSALGHGGTGLLLLLLGLATLVPGVAPLFGIALCTVALSLVAGRPTPWLPAWLARREIPPAKLRAALAWMEPRVTWLERRMRRRLPGLLTGRALRLAGLAALLDGFLIVMPVPFGNAAPALAVLVLSLGLATGDGLAVAAGLLGAVVALVLDAALLLAGGEAVLWLIRSATG